MTWQYRNETAFYVDNMEDDDDDKKLKRRQRNKEAAARCRQRRLDLMKELQEQVAGHKDRNDKKTMECNELRSKLMSLKSFFETHDCKLSHEERMRFAAHIVIPPPTASAQVQLQHQLRVHPPPRAESVAHSVMSNHSSSSSEQHSPVEDYKPTIDQLLLPPISSIANNKDRIINSMPPPLLPQSTSSAGIHIVTSIPIPNSSGSHSVPSHSTSRSENVFAEPELKVPKMDGMDRTLASLASPDELERPSMLPMLSQNVISQPMTTPSRIFRNVYSDHYPTPNGVFNLGPDVHGDFLATNTGLTPSTQPTMAFVSTPTPLAQSSDSDLRPL